MIPRILRVLACTINLLIVLSLTFQPVLTHTAYAAGAVARTGIQEEPPIEEPPIIDGDGAPLDLPIPEAAVPVAPDEAPVEVPLDGLFLDGLFDEFPSMEGEPSPQLHEIVDLPSTPVDLIVELDRYLLTSGEEAVLSVRADRVPDVTLDADVQIHLTLPLQLKVVGSETPALAWTLPAAAPEESLAVTYTVAIDPAYTVAASVVEIRLSAAAADHESWQERWVVGLIAAQDATAPVTEPEVAVHATEGAVLQTPGVTLLVPAGAAAAGASLEYAPLYMGVPAAVTVPISEANAVPPVSVLNLPFVQNGSSHAAVAQTIEEPPPVEEQTPPDEAAPADEPLAAGIDPSIPYEEDNGVAFYRTWHLSADIQVSAADGEEPAEHPQFETPVLMVVDVADLVAQGLDMELVQLWTRPDASFDWRPVRAHYDTKRLAWVAWLDHFSDFGLGIAPSATGDLLPSVRGASSDLQTGAATFSYPIRTPTGMGGLNPNLSFNYSSGVVDEIYLASGHYGRRIQANTVGYGWSLGGHNAITTFHDKNGNTFYSLTLNGKSYDIKPVPGTTNQYHTHPFSFAAIRLVNNLPTASYWQIKMPDGTLYEFGDRALPSAGWTSGTRDTAVEMHYYVKDNTKTREVARWHLRYVFSPNVAGGKTPAIMYTYLAERGQVGSGCYPSGTPTDQQWYTKATYLTQVSWGMQVQGVSGTLSTAISNRLRVRLLYASRTDTGLESDCQQRVSDKRLSEVFVEANDSANTNNWHLLRRYMLAHAYPTPPNPDARPLRHLALTSVKEYGKAGGLLNTHSFTYVHRLNGDSDDTINAVRLKSVNNGYGGIVTYTYVEWAVECPGGDATCNDRKRSMVEKTQIADGVGNYNITAYTYNKPHVAIQNDRLLYLGASTTTRTVYAPTTNPSGTLTVARFEQHDFYRGSYSSPDARVGKPKEVRVWDKSGTGSVQYSGTLYGWEVLDPVGTGPIGTATSWTQRVENNNAIIPLGDQPIWVHLISQATWINGVGTHTRYFYETSRQNNVQYGNLTRVQERSHDAATVTYASFKNDVTSNSLPLRRTTETSYYPNYGWPASLSAPFIVDRPARVITRNAGGTCVAETRTVYIDFAAGEQNRGGAYNVIPKSTLVAKTAQVVHNCQTVSDTITNRWDANLIVTSFEYDEWSNITKTIKHGHASDGSQDIDLQTTYDGFYRTFPLEHWFVDNSNIKERYWFYGVNNVLLDGTHSARSFWGEPAKVCRPNDLCTRYGYDEFGRLERRWDNLESGAAWPSNASANVQWGYYPPGAFGTSQKTYVTTEWHSPRCYGNLTRQHYDGLGQLIMAQSTYNGWQQNVDGCGTNDLGQELHVNYQYDASGQVVRQSVPRIKARGDWLTYAVSWGAVPHSRTTYNPAGQVTRTYAPNNEQIDYNYAGRALSVIQAAQYGAPAKVLKWQQLDPLGYLDQVRTYYASGTSWAVGTTIDLTYDVMGNLTHILYPDGMGTSTFTYDQVNRQVAMNDINLGSWSYAYNRLNQRVRQTDARGRVTCLYYDAIGRYRGTDFNDQNNTCPSWPTSFDILLNYDQGHSAGNRSRDQLTQVVVRDGAATIYDKQLTYNDRGLPAAETVAYSGLASITMQFSYDSHLRLHKITYPDGEVLTHAYNERGMVNKLTSNTGGVLADSGSYNEAGLLSAVRFPAGGNLWRTQVYYPWNTAGPNANARLHQIMVGTGSGTHDKLHLAYAYDPYGNVTTFNEKYNNGSYAPVNFTYDAYNRLTGAFGKTYSWDAQTRLSTFEGRTHTYPAAGAPRDHALLATSNGLTFAYDANGNMTKREFNNNGKHTQTLAWNDANQLRSVSESGVSTETYWYDADGIRIRKQRGTVNTFYPSRYYELEQNGSTTTATKYYYLGGLRIALRVNGTLSYLHSDHLGSIAATTSGTSVTGTRLYLAFGSKRGGNDYSFEPNYTGQRLDDTGLLYYNARYYDAARGQFISPDTLIPDLTDVLAYNRYLYANGNPFKYNDPTGHCPAPPQGSGPTICMALFIKPDRVEAGPFTLHGDGRSFDNNSDPSQSRGYAWIGVGSDHVETHMNPSTYIAPASIVGHEGYITVDPSPQNHWLITRKENGDIMVQYDLVISGILDISGTAPHINGSVTFRPNEDGSYGYAFDRDGFPWAEAYYHDGKGNIQTLFNDPAIRGNPHDLFAIEPSITPQGRLISFGQSMLYGPPQESIVDFACHPGSPC